MKKQLTIKTLEQVRAASDPLRIAIISELVKGEYTGKQLGSQLGLAASKVHYHLKELEHHGFVEVVRTEEKNGIMQKFYRAVAYDFCFDDSLLPSMRHDTQLGQESIINQLRMAISRAKEAPPESFLEFAEGDNRPPLMHILGEVTAPRDELKAWMKKYRAVLKELDDIEARHLERVKSGQADETGEVMFMVNIAFMTDQRLFNADEQETNDKQTKE